MARPGVYSRNTDRLSRRTETDRRIASINRILGYRRLKLNLWGGTSHVLSSPTGATQVFEALSHLWPEAERLAGRAFDPLDPDLIDWMERS
ncbi:hypothetical protein [Rhodospirillum sp. A1_3_36]|uniref:hypothetical protein n=1 Tax=Rhodospirillum sp. A1_3_36 TaxID=3391666 RepID=UPI0039A48008